MRPFAPFQSLQFAREQQQEAEEARAALGDLETRVREAERKVQRYAAENTTLASELERADKARKAAEGGRDDVHTELETLRRELGTAVDARRRLEGDLALKADELDELHAEVEELAEKDRRLAGELEQATTALVAERDNSAKLEQRLQTLERANAELRDQVDAATRDGEKKYKNRLLGLESKLSALQTDLDTENRKAQEALGKVKRLDRKNKDMARLLEEAEKASAEHKANAERVNAKVRNSQVQLEELELELNAVRQKNRRLQSELNEATELSEQLRSQLASLQARNARVANRRRAGSTTADSDAAETPTLVIAEQGE